MARRLCSEGGKDSIYRQLESHMKGAEQLTRARLHGYLPSKPVELWLGRDGPYLGEFGIDDLFVAMQDPVGRLDLRCLHGLAVWLVVPTEDASALIDPMVDRLKAHGVAALTIFRLWLDNEDAMTIEEVGV
jgi:hypothetical protein